MANKLDKVVIYHEEIPLIKVFDPSFTLFCMVTWQVKYFISCTIPMATKHGKMGTPFKHVFTRGHGTN